MKVKDMILVALMGSLTAVGAWIAIPLPFSPVPFTLQLLFTVLAGLLLGARLGALSQIIYVSLGAVGLPVFAGGKSGLPILVGPTGGYLIGFILAAYIIGKLTEKEASLKPVRTFLVLTLGLAVVYVLGTTQLALVLGMTGKQAFLIGVAPYIVVDLLKIGVATLLGVAVKAALVNANLIKPSNY